jgi:hypothetical protein
MYEPIPFFNLVHRRRRKKESRDILSPKVARMIDSNSIDYRLNE